jgi:flagellar biosynthesis protein FlhF
MNLQTFSASSMAEALAQVKQTLGHDAVILHTRTFNQRYWLGIRKREIVQITAGTGLQTIDRPRRGARAGLPLAPGGRNQTQRNEIGHHRQAGEYLQPLAPNTFRGVYSPATGTFNPNTASALSPRTPQNNAPAARPSETFLNTPAANTAAVLGLSQEVTGLKQLVQELVHKNTRERLPQVPEELFNHYMQLIDNQVAQELATEVLRAVREQLRPELLTQPGAVDAKIAELLEKWIPSAGPIVRTKQTGPHTVALIGPTGVGKTTTLAKLAAHLKLREQRRIGMITLDNFRIAAIDQLSKYAKILGCEMRCANSPEELRDAVAAMSDNEFLLIDTAGRSPRDTLKLNELKCFLDAVGPTGPDEVHLVLSSTVSQQCVDLAVTRFSQVRTDKIIFTKLDEAAHIGVILNVVRKLNKSLSYVTTGQNVPDDIEVGKGRELARRILGTQPLGLIEPAAGNNATATPGAANATVRTGAA